MTLVQLLKLAAQALICELSMVIEKKHQSNHESFSSQNFIEINNTHMLFDFNNNNKK